MHYLSLTIGLSLIYLLLTWNFETSNIIIGLILSFGIALLIKPKRGAISISISRLPGALVAAVLYVIIIFYDLLVSGIQVASIVLRPSLPIKPGIIAIPSGTGSELATALSAHAITLTPGELVVEIGDDGIMYTHTLDATHPEEDVRKAQDLRRNLLEKLFA